VFLLEKLTDQFGDAEFRLFESWLPRISSWADHDGLVQYPIAPMVAARPDRTTRVFRWAKSTNRWHRRAACVLLIQDPAEDVFP
jgi:3-methyladenine DNA glycosylase AlkD